MSDPGFPERLLDGEGGGAERWQPERPPYNWQAERSPHNYDLLRHGHLEVVDVPAREVLEVIGIEAELDLDDLAETFDGEGLR